MDPGSGRLPLARRIAYWVPLLARFFWLQAAAQLLAIASGYLHDKHVNMDLLVRKLPPAWAARAAALAELLRSRSPEGVGQRS